MLALATAALAACSGGGNLTTATLPNLPEIPKIDLPKPPPPVVGTSTEVYERIGRGAKACWFGADGPLKSTHAYEAIAEPPHRGGRAEITIRQLDTGSTNPRGVKAFRVVIEPSGEDETTVATENLKIPEPIASRMKDSVAAWSIGKHGCNTESATDAWSPPADAEATANKPAENGKATQRNARVVKPKS